MSKLRGVAYEKPKFHMPQQESFIGQLSYDDLQKLRMVVKRVHMRYYPKDQVTDWEADRILEAQGREWAEDALRVLIEKRLQDK